MQIDFTPSQAQMVINCLQYALQKQIEDGNALLAVLNAAFAPPVVTEEIEKEP